MMVDVSRRPERSTVIIVRAWIDDGRFRSKVISVADLADGSEVIQYAGSAAEVGERVVDALRTLERRSQGDRATPA